MKVRIQGRYGYANATDMLELLGLKRTANLPREGMPERLIQGVRVYVKPLPPGPPTGKHRNFQGLRVMAICECGQHLAVGRMIQHKCKIDSCTCPTGNHLSIPIIDDRCPTHGRTE